MLKLSVQMSWKTKLEQNNEISQTIIHNHHFSTDSHQFHLINYFSLITIKIKQIRIWNEIKLCLKQDRICKTGYYIDYFYFCFLRLFYLELGFEFRYKKSNELLSIEID